MKRKLVRLQGDKFGQETQKLMKFLQQEVKGQNRAIKDLMRAFVISRVGLRNPVLPLHIALYLGPSGVGKTYLAKMLAKYLFGDQDAITLINCEKFSEPHRISELIGSPPGYVNSWDPSDSKYSGMEPLLSQFNIDRHDFVHRLRTDEDFSERTFDLRGWIEKRDKLYKRIAQLAKEGRLGTDLSGKLDATLKRVKEIIEQNEQVAEYFKKRGPNRPNIQALRGIYTELYDESNRSDLRSIVIFDEIEKAHQTVHNLLLGIMQEGRLTLPNGMVTRFDHSFIFLTSNVGSSEIKGTLTGEGIVRGFTPNRSNRRETDQQVYETAMEEVKRFFPPEFIGRIDQIVVFRSLNAEAMAQILEIQLRDLHNLVVHSKVPIELVVSQEVKDYLVAKAMKYVELGARLLRKRIEEKLLPELSEFIDSGQIKKGDRIHVKLEVRGDDQEIVFLKEEGPNLPINPNTGIDGEPDKDDEKDGGGDEDMDIEKGDFEDENIDEGDMGPDEPEESAD